MVADIQKELAELKNVLPKRRPKNIGTKYSTPGVVCETS